MWVFSNYITCEEVTLVIAPSRVGLGAVFLVPNRRFMLAGQRQEGLEGLEGLEI